MDGIETTGEEKETYDNDADLQGLPQMPQEIPVESGYWPDRMSELRRGEEGRR